MEASPTRVESRLSHRSSASAPRRFTPSSPTCVNARLTCVRLRSLATSAAPAQFTRQNSTLSSSNFVSLVRHESPLFVIRHPARFSALSSPNDPIVPIARSVTRVRARLSSLSLTRPASATTSASPASLTHPAFKTSSSTKPATARKPPSDCNPPSHRTFLHRSRDKKRSPRSLPTCASPGPVTPSHPARLSASRDAAAAPSASARNPRSSNWSHSPRSNRASDRNAPRHANPSSVSSAHFARLREASEAYATSRRARRNSSVAAFWSRPRSARVRCASSKNGRATARRPGVASRTARRTRAARGPGGGRARWARGGGGRARVPRP